MGGLAAADLLPFLVVGVGLPTSIQPATDAPVVVPDEATAALDPDDEAAVQDALSELVAGRTVPVIAHRLHTVAGADQILVLDAGSLVEADTHTELLTPDGWYASTGRCSRPPASN